MVSVIGIVLALALLVGLAKRSALPWIVAGTGAFMSTVAIVVGGNGIIPFYLSVIVVLGLIILNAPLELRKGSISGPGYLPLVFFTVWSLLITLLGPTLFAGIPVLVPRGGIDEQVAAPSPLQYTISNAAQAVYLLLGVAAAVYFARRRNLSPSVPASMFWVGIGLSAMNYVITRIGIPWPAFFDNSPNVRYINFQDDGATPRFRGIFAEPSGLALFSVTAFVFFTASAYTKTGRGRKINIAGALLSLALVILCAAGTSIAGAAVVIAVLGFIAVTRFATGQSNWHPGAVLTGLALFCVFLFVGKELATPIFEIVQSKLESSSFRNRTSANSLSVQVMLDSWGLGAGLGSSRPGALFTMLLSCVGLPGVALFIWSMAALIFAAWQKPEWRPSALALAAFLLVKTISGANLSDPALWILVGVCANGVWQVQSKKRRQGKLTVPYEPVSSSLPPDAPAGS